MDITQTILAKSDQQNFDDYLVGERTVTIAAVKSGSSEQPVEIALAEYPGRPYKPSKSMRRVLVSAWGSETSSYVGRKMTLYGDPNVKFGGQVVGGIKISHLSHIDKPLKIALTISRGKREPFIVQPLQDKGADKEKSFVANSVAPPAESAPAEVTWPEAKIGQMTKEDLEKSGADMGARRESVITEKQLSLIGVLMRKLGMTDKEIALNYVRSVINRDVASSAELSSFEASNLITALQKDEDQQKLAAEAKGEGIEE